MLDPTLFGPTSNLALVGPYRLSLEQFNAAEVAPQVAEARHAIHALQSAIEALDSRHTIVDKDITPVHRFTAGIYMRELTMPPGFIIVGKRHAQEHIVVMTEGFCTVLTERGWEDLTAPCTFTSPAGEKRVLFVHEQTTWQTIHRTDATNLEDVERDLILTEVSCSQVNTEQRIEEQE